MLIEQANASTSTLWTVIPSSQPLPARQLSSPLPVSTVSHSPPVSHVTTTVFTPFEEPQTAQATSSVNQSPKTTPDLLSGLIPPDNVTSCSSLTTPSHLQNRSSGNSNSEPLFTLPTSDDNHPDIQNNNLVSTCYSNSPLSLASAPISTPTPNTADSTTSLMANHVKTKPLPSPQRSPIVGKRKPLPRPPSSSSPMASASPPANVSFNQGIVTVKISSYVSCSI